MQERIDLIVDLLSLTPEELEQAITLFESGRSQQRREAVSPHRPTGT